MKLIGHACRIVDELGKRRTPDGLIDAIGSVELIRGCGLAPSHYGKVFGQAIALLDAACVTAELPWLGRLVICQTPVNDFQGIWAPHRREIVNAPLTWRWTDGDLDRIREKIPRIGPNKWWADAMKAENDLSERVLAGASNARCHYQPPAIHLKPEFSCSN